MYDSWFHFRRRPFSAAPHLQDYFPGQTIESARKTIVEGVRRGTGPQIVVGGTGTGKTILGMKLLDTFRTTTPVAHICCSGLSESRTFLQAVLFELGRPYRRLDDGELRLTLMDFLTSRDSTESGVLLLLDDAHHLPLEVIDEMRMISNLVRDGNWCANLVLFGTPKLEEMMTLPQLESFEQRLASRCYLSPFQRLETIQYIREAVARVIAKPAKIFNEAALQRIHDHTCGVPRLINQLCDHALLLAASGERRQLDSDGIDEAWYDVQQLPQPKAETATPHLFVSDDDAGQNTIEFGVLNDDDSLEAEPSIAPAQANTLPTDHTEYAQQVVILPKDYGDAAGPDVDTELDLDDEDVDKVEMAIEGEMRSAILSPPLPACANPFSEDFEQEEHVINRIIPPENQIWQQGGKHSPDDELIELIGELPDDVGDSFHKVEDHTSVEMTDEIAAVEPPGEPEENEPVAADPEDVPSPVHTPQLEARRIVFPPLDSASLWGETSVAVFPTKFSADGHSRSESTVDADKQHPESPQSALTTYPAEVAFPVVEIPISAFANTDFPVESRMTDQESAPLEHSTPSQDPLAFGSAATDSGSATSEDRSNVPITLAENQSPFPAVLGQTRLSSPLATSIDHGGDVSSEDDHAADLAAGIADLLDSMNLDHEPAPAQATPPQRRFRSLFSNMAKHT
ncbi:MAG: AAA family ATPase [Planctomycetales bacterium]|nr:AAA family ATPase [Planctomycetales bacterium]